MLRVFTAFSGYDSQCMALDRLHHNYPDFNYKLVGWSEIDKYAIAAHNELFPLAKRKNYGDISDIDWDDVPDFDLFTYSSPCTDISQIGLKMGAEKGSGTRSALLWECEEPIKIKRPKYLLLENVRNIKGEVLDKWRKLLERYGYTNYYKLLNAKDFGVPQSRNRMIMISIRGRQGYEFPKPKKLTETMSDRLKSRVDSKYYFTPERLRDYKQHNRDMEKEGNKFEFIIRNPKSDIACCVTAGSQRYTDNYIQDRKGVRRLTPYEYLRFMDVSEKRAAKICGLGLSDAQIYKMAGNSIVVSVLYYVLKNLLIK